MTLFSSSSLLLSALLAAAVHIGSAAMQCKADANSGGPASTLPRVSLYRDVFCEYDVHVQPQKDMDLTVELFVRRARVVQRTMEVKVLTNLRWTDPFLTWDPARYDNIQQIQVSTDKIWIPTLGTVVTLPWLRDGASQEGLWPAVCHVTSNGTVTCTTAMDMGGACTVSHRHWPHVKAMCTAFIGLDFRVEKGVRLAYYNESDEDAELLNYVPDNDWMVGSVDRRSMTFMTEEDVVESVALTYGFRLFSRGAVLSTALFGPVVVVSVLLLGSFCLPSSHARLGLCCCATLGTVIASSLLFEKLPPFEGPNPIIVTVYSGLLVLSTIAILMTLLLNILVPIDSVKPLVPPRWLYSMQSWLTNSTSGKIILSTLIMFPHEMNVCQAIELMPALHMQIGNLAAEAHNEREEVAESSPHMDAVVETLNSAAQLSLGPHKIWDFMASFLNRCLFCIFLATCIALFSYLAHDMTVVEEIDLIDFYF